MKKTKSIVWGIIFILLAVCLVVNHLGIIPGGIPFIRIAIAVLLAYIAIKGIIKLEFFEFFVPLALIINLFDDEITDLTKVDITSLTPWTVLLVAVLLSIGFGMIFKKSKKHINFKSTQTSYETVNGQKRFENNFNGTIKYIKGEIENVQIENNFGKTVVYFDNAVISKGIAYVNIENNFGATEVYIPGTWRVNVNQDMAFGNVKLNGEPNNDMDAPLLNINAESNFGEIIIFFQ